MARKPKATTTKSRKRGGAVKLTEGPLDSATHSELSNEQLSKHINIMQNRRKSYHDKLLSEKEKYENKAQLLLDKKKTYEQNLETKRQERLQKRNVDAGINAEQSRASVQASLGFLKSMGIAIWKVIKGIWNGMKSIGKGGFNIISTKNFFMAALLMILAFLLVIAFLLFLIWLIWPSKIESWFRGGKEKLKEGSDDECKNITEINISNFGIISKLNNLLGDKYDKITSYRPKFPSISNNFNTGAFSILLNPFNGIKNVAVDLQTKVLNSEVGRTVSGIFPPPVTRTSRDILSNGRSDNITMIDASVINNDNVLNETDIIISKTSINIGKPEDIKWQMPENDYRNKDFNKLPDSLKNLKDENNISLNDKKSIIIPWKKKNNKYKLSCSDAYFENSVDEKAKILIDNNDGTKCTFDVNSKALSYNEPKERYKYAQDLSIFL